MHEYYAGLIHAAFTTPISKPQAHSVRRYRTREHSNARHAGTHTGLRARMCLYIKKCIPYSVADPDPGSGAY